MEGVVSHCQRDWPLRLGMNTHLCVCGVCVVVFRLDDVLLALSRVYWRRMDSGKNKLSTNELNSSCYSPNNITSVTRRFSTQTPSQELPNYSHFF